MQDTWRVTVVSETYPPEVNGVAATISRVVDGLCSRGHQVQLVRPRQSPADEPKTSTAFKEVLVRGQPIPRYPDLKMGLTGVGALLKLWREQRPDVVHLVTEGPLGLQALRAARHLGLPVVSDFRTNFQAYSQHYGLAWLRAPITAYLRGFHNRSACTMVPTLALRSELATLGFERLRVVSRGVDTQLFDATRRDEALRASWGAGPQTMVALYVGRLAPEKNLGALVAAFNAMQQQDPMLRLVVVGDGPQKQNLQQQLPGALFAGVRRGTDLAAHYASADVFLFPSITETFGNVVTEAMASGLATVAFDHAAAGQLIRHGDNGVLARYDDTPEFCRVACTLAGELKRVRMMGASARATACRLDWARIIDAIEAEYAAAMATPASMEEVVLRPA